jgi:hypothetical protein
MGGSRDETKDLEAPATRASPGVWLRERGLSWWSALRTRALWAVLAAAALIALLATLTLPASRRGPESHVVFGALVMRNSGPEMVEKSVGGLHAGEFLADVRVEIAANEPVPGEAWMGVLERVRDRASSSVSIESGRVASSESTRGPDAGRAFLADDAAVKGVIARAVDRMFPELDVGTLISSGTSQRVRVESGPALRTALLVIATVLGIVAGAVGITPRVRAWIRSRAIERGDCPKCALGLANMRERRCPKCGLEVTPAEFNRLRAVWRAKGVG